MHYLHCLALLCVALQLSLSQCYSKTDGDGSVLFWKVRYDKGRAVYQGTAKAEEKRVQVDAICGSCYRPVSRSRRLVYPVLPVCFVSKSRSSCGESWFGERKSCASQAGRRRWKVRMGNGGLEHLNTVATSVDTVSTDRVCVMASLWTVFQSLHALLPLKVLTQRNIKSITKDDRCSWQVIVISCSLYLSVKLYKLIYSYRQDLSTSIYCGQ